MPSTFIRRLFLWAVVLLLLFSLSRSLISPSTMDNLDSPFTIEIDGTPIAKVEGSVHDSPVHASLGSESAVFTLQDKRLKCGDLVLARNKTEDRSLLPKKVLWFHVDNAELVQPVTVRKDGEEYQIQFGGKPLVADDGKVSVEIMGDTNSKVVLKIQ